MSGGANHSRLTSITYVDGYVLTYNYSSGLNDSISRLSSLSDTSGTLESYDYLGSGTVVRRAHPQPNVDLSYVKRSGESSGAAGDEYTGLDRFGRVFDQGWLDPTSGTATDRFQYAYDLVSNRTSRDNLVNTAFGELYAYDDLSQLVSFQRGTLNGTKTGLTGSASRSQSWDTDAVGNFDSVTTDGTAQTRTANKQNQITSISGATTPTYDDNGNMTGDETGRQFVYDAWNRLVVVKNSGGTTLETFKYDGLNRRVSSDDGTTTTDLYYSSDWQVLSEKVGSNYTKRYVWSPVYVDAMVLRDRDTDANGSLDERLWVQQDANWNVTSLVDGSGVVERYNYDPYGVRTVYDASYTVRSGGTAYDFQHGFQGMRYDLTSGLDEAQMRWYTSTLGIWTSLDSARFAGGDDNLYRFVDDNPITFVDPCGKLKITPVGQFQKATKAGDTSLIAWNFELGMGAPEAGYIIQHIQVFYSSFKRIPNDPKGLKLPAKPSTEFWEAFSPVYMGDTLPVVQTPAAGALRLKYTDLATFTVPAKSCGLIKFKGEVRFYTGTTISGGKPNNGLDKQGWRADQVYGKGKPYAASPKNLLSTGKKPTWWAKKPTEGPAFRQLVVLWDTKVEPNHVESGADPLK